MKDSRLSRALTWIIDLIFSGVLWTLFSLPVFTVGAASTGLYYAAVKCIRRERGRLWPVFWKGFRDNFRCATKLWLLFLAAMLVGAANVLAARQWSGQGISPLTALGGVIFLPAALMLPWLFAYVSRFDNSLVGSLKFVAVLVMRNPGRSLLLTAELLGALAICWLIPQIAPLLPGAIALLMSLTIEPVFRPFTADASVEDDWFNE